MKLGCGCAALAAAVTGLWAAAAAPVAAQQGRPTGFRTIPMRVVPPVAGVEISLGATTVVSDARGRAQVRVPTFSTRRRVTSVGLHNLPPGYRPVKVRDTGLPDGGRAELARVVGGRALGIALSTYHTFRPSFIAIDGRRIQPGEVESYTMRGRHGVRVTVRGSRPVELQSSRVVRLRNQLRTKEIDWSIEQVMVEGANVVNRSQQRFFPGRLREAFPVDLLFYRALFVSKDAIFGFNVGSAIRLRYPNGQVREFPFRPDGTVTIPALPRGDYTVDVRGGGMSFQRPVALSRNQVVDLKVVSYLDFAVILIGSAALAIGLVVARRPHLRSRAALRRRLRRARAPVREHTDLPYEEPAEERPPERVGGGKP